MDRAEIFTHNWTKNGSSCYIVDTSTSILSTISQEKILVSLTSDLRLCGINVHAMFLAPISSGGSVGSVLGYGSNPNLCGKLRKDRMAPYLRSCTRERWYQTICNLTTSTVSLLSNCRRSDPSRMDLTDSAVVTVEHL